MLTAILLPNILFFSSLTAVWWVFSGDNLKQSCPYGCFNSQDPVRQLKPEETFLSQHARAYW